MILYEDYVWRLTSTAPAFDVQLPQDLEWVDEFTWSPIKQSTDVTLTGALVVQESRQDVGRPITLQGAQDDMGWITRALANTLVQMRDTSFLVMKLAYQHFDVATGVYGTEFLHYNVMFRHIEAPVLELESPLHFDTFESSAPYKIKSLKFMEALPQASSNTCSSSVILALSSIVGTFQIGETVTGGTSGAVAVVTAFPTPTLYTIVTFGAFVVGEPLTGTVSHATAVVG